MNWVHQTLQIKLFYFLKQNESKYLNISWNIKTNFQYTNLYNMHVVKLFQVDRKFIWPQLYRNVSTIYWYCMAKLDSR